MIAVASLAAACGPPTAQPVSTGATPPESVNAARVSRARTALPAGYEVSDLVGPSTPLVFWGFGPAVSADPPDCTELTNVGSAAAPVRGWSASGPGGIVYATVADASRGPDPALVASCGEWSASAGHTRGHIAMVGAPDLERARTLGMIAEATTRVENGTETRSHAATFIAFLGGHAASVTVVSDPGSTDAALGPDFAARLLGTIVAALRGG